MKLLAPGQTQSLSLQACVNRILEQYVALQNYFTLAVNKDPTHSNDRIHRSLQNKFTLTYLEFLSYQLDHFNSFNILFQSEKPLLHCLKKELESLIKSIASDFMVMDYVKKTVPSQIDPKCSCFHVPLKQVYLGMAATFRTDCRNFLIESIEQIQKRIDLDAEILTIVQCILPANTASLTPTSLQPICKKLPYLNECLDTSKLDREWHQHVFESEVKSEMRWNEYWSIIKKLKTATGDCKYPNLLRFVSVLASFPFSNLAR